MITVAEKILQKGKEKKDICKKPIYLHILIGESAHSALLFAFREQWEVRFPTLLHINRVLDGRLELRHAHLAKRP